MRTKHKIIGSVLLVAALAAIVGAAFTFSAFTATTSNSANQFKAGTVVLGDNDLDAKLFSLTNMQPGVPVVKCLTVTYTGTLDAKVRIYGTTTASAPGKELAPNLNLRVTRGTGPSSLDCTGFTAGSVLYDSTLGVFPATYTDGVQDPTTWHENDTAVYQVRAEVQDVNAAQGKDAETELTFEAHDVTP
jgi:camelysin-like metallo-endopeptidase